MSIQKKCMQQVHENIAFAGNIQRQAPELMRYFVRLGFVICGALVFTGCGSPTGQQTADSKFGAPPQSEERILKRGLPGEPQTLDPQLANDTYSSQVIRDLYEGLTAEDRFGKIIPGASDYWTENAEGTVYRFHLRPNALWSNGDHTTAPEFVEGLRRAVDPKTASGAAAMLKIIKGAGDVIAGKETPTHLSVRALSESEVEIELEHAAPYLLEILSQPIAFPIHTQARDASKPSEKFAVTNGPYILGSRLIGSFTDLKRNSRYWDAAHIGVARVRYMIAESEATEERQYLAGQIDLTFTIPLTDLERVSTAYRSQFQTAPILATLYLALNLKESPLKNSRELRQALSMAVDRELIAKQVMTGVTPAYTLVAKGISGYSPPDYPWAKESRETQLQTAKELFAKSGYSVENPLRLKLYYNRDEGIQRLMVAIAGSWKQNLGVQTELVSDEFRVFLSGRNDRAKWDVLRIGWSADYNDPTSFLEVFSSASNQNDPGYLNSIFNEALDNATKEANPEKRAQLLSQAEQTLLGDYPIIPIYFYNARRLVKLDVGGAAITPMNRTYSKYLYWKPTT